MNPQFLIGFGLSFLLFAFNSLTLLKLFHKKRVLFSILNAIIGLTASYLIGIYFSHIIKYTNFFYIYITSLNGDIFKNWDDWNRAFFALMTQLFTKPPIFYPIAYIISIVYMSSISLFSTSIIFSKANFIAIFMHLNLAIFTFGIYPILSIICFFVSFVPYKTKLKLIRGVKVYFNENIGLTALRDEIRKDSPACDGVEIYPGFAIPKAFERLNFILAGGMGSGKTVWLLSVLEQCYKRQDKMIVLDIKGDFAQYYAGHDDVLILGPCDERSHQWAIAEDVSTQLEAAEFAAMLFPDPGGAGSFFCLAARDVVTGAIVCCQKMQGDKWCIEDLRSILCNNLMLYKLLEEHSPATLQSLSDCCIEGEGEQERLAVGKTSAGILQQIRSQGQLLDFLSYAWPTYSSESFSITKWVKNESTPIKMVILQYRERYQNLSKFFCGQILDLFFKEILSLKDNTDRRIGCFLDELGFLPRIPAFLTAAKGGRSKGLRLFVGVQETGVIQAIYDKDGGRETIITGFSNKLIGRGETKEFAEYWCKTFGKNIYLKFSTKSTLQPNGKQSLSRDSEEIEMDTLQTGDILKIPPAGLKRGCVFFMKLAGSSVVRAAWPIVPRPKVYPDFLPAKWLVK